MRVRVSSPARNRAILGSVERMFAILIEHTGGRWPLWLSPRQVCVLPVTQHHVDRAVDITEQLQAAGYYAGSEGVLTWLCGG